VIAFNDVDLIDGHTTSATEKFTATVSDGHGGTTAQVVAVSVAGTNDAPTILAQDLVGAVTALAEITAAPAASPFLFTVQQYLGYQINDLALLRSYAAFLDNHGGSVARTVSMRATGAHTFSGDAAANSLVGSAFPDEITGFGGNDMLTGGGGADTFIFGPSAGYDTITDFTLAGAGADRIALSVIAAMTSFAQAMAATTQDGANAVIHLSANDAITLIGVNVAQLVASDFMFA